MDREAEKNMTVAHLLAEHRQILVAVERLESLVAGPRPDRVDGLSRKRWAFTRDLLLHFTHVEAWVHAPLLADTRAEAVRAAHVSRDETARLIADFRGHTARWYGFPAAGQWGEYGLVVDDLMGRIRARLTAQVRALYPLLPARPRASAVTPQPLSYAAGAWEIRQLIYGKDGAPIVEQSDEPAPWAHFERHEAAFGTSPA
ncbi:MAG: hypothetical protein ACAH11_14400 [Sphingomonas sp.]